jgi:putative aldouronate transport system permease protein
MALIPAPAIAAARVPRPARGPRRISVDSILIYLGLGLFAILVTFPIIHVLARSLSAEVFVRAGLVSVLPIGFNLHGYARLLEGKLFLTGLRNSVIITAVSLPFQMLLTTAAAFALSRPRLPGRSWLIILFIIPMVFPPGIIPFYLVVREIGLINSLWAVIVPYGMTVFYMVIMRSYFMTIPIEVEEAALIDGADHLQILIRIFLPLATPVLATIALFYFVEDWNLFLPAVFFIRDGNLQPLQVVLRDIIFSGQAVAGSPPPEQWNLLAGAKAMESGAVILTALPIFIVCPFLQRYFNLGLTLGAVKG